MKYKQKWSELTDYEKGVVSITYNEDLDDFVDDEGQETISVKDWFECDPDSWEFIDLNTKDKTSVELLAEYLYKNGEMEAFNEARRAAEVIIQNKDYIFKHIRGENANLS